MRIQKLTIRASYSGLFRSPKHIAEIHADGLAIRIPAGPRDANQGGGSGGDDGSSGSGLVVDNFNTASAMLEFAPRERGAEPLRFAIHELRVGPVGGDDTASYDVVVENPKPAGLVQAHGRIGPWKSVDRAHLPVSGSYTFSHANLGTFHGIAGTLSSKGKFHGVLEHIEVEGTTDTPDFEVTSSHHAIDLKTTFHAIVNGTDGDTLLEPVDARFERTAVSSHGGVLGRKEERVRPQRSKWFRLRAVLKI